MAECLPMLRGASTSVTSENLEMLRSTNSLPFLPWFISIRNRKIGGLYWYQGPATRWYKLFHLLFPRHFSVQFDSLFHYSVSSSSTYNSHMSMVWTSGPPEFCSVLQCVAVFCNVLQCVAVCCRVLQCVAVYCSALQCVAVCCRVLPCVAVCCSVLQCVAGCCRVLQCALQDSTVQAALLALFSSHPHPQPLALITLIRVNTHANAFWMSHVTHME